MVFIKHLECQHKKGKYNDTVDMANIEMVLNLGSGPLHWVARWGQFYEFKIQI